MSNCILHPHYEANTVNAALLLKYFALQHLNISFPPKVSKNTGKFQHVSDPTVSLAASIQAHQKKWKTVNSPTLARATISLRKSPDVSDMMSFSSSVLYTRKQRVLFRKRVSYKYSFARKGAANYWFMHINSYNLNQVWRTMKTSPHLPPSNLTLLPASHEFHAIMKLSWKAYTFFSFRPNLYY